MTKINEIYLNFHGDRPSMPFTSEAEARAHVTSPAVGENPPSEVATAFIRRDAVLEIINRMARGLKTSDALECIRDIREEIAALGNPAPGASS